jgi:hypothetical protein
MKRGISVGVLVCLVFVSLYGSKAELRLNQIQIIGTHNSYHLRPSSEILKTHASLDYGHAPLKEQLEAGVRSFAVDIYKTERGFRVLHIPGIDEGSNCDTLKECLGEMVNWSNQHPDHVPLIVFIEVKNLKEPTGELIPMDNVGMDQLEELLWMEVGEVKLLTPDEVRGEESSLEAAVLHRGWPLLDSVRGRILIVLNAPEQLQDYYTDVSPSLSGRAMFVKTEPGNPEAAVVVSNDPTSDKTADWIRKGYLVRSRADNGVKEAAANDTRNRDAAFASGAHIITTDFPSPTPHPRTSYVVALPDGKAWRVNPVTASDVEH